jgi:hypothetical protein
MLLLARTMAFGQGKVTNKQAGACFVSDFSCPYSIPIDEGCREGKDGRWQAR